MWMAKPCLPAQQHPAPAALPSHTISPSTHPLLTSLCVPPTPSPQISPADYIKPAFVPNFRAAWEALPEDSEMVDDYGIGQRDSLQVGAHCRGVGAWWREYRGQTGAGQGGGARWRGSHAGPQTLSKSWGAMPRPPYPRGAILLSLLMLPRSSSLPLPQDAVEAVGRILGMQACEGTDAVPPNARSHTLLLAGTLVGDVQVGAGGGGVEGRGCGCGCLEVGKRGRRWLWCSCRRAAGSLPLHLPTAHTSARCTEPACCLLLRLPPARLWCGWRLASMRGATWP